MDFFVWQKIQQELEVQQKKVDNLQDMVVVVDDTNTESGKGTLTPSQVKKQVQNTNTESGKETGKKH